MKHRPVDCMLRGTHAWVIWTIYREFEPPGWLAWAVEIIGSVAASLLAQWLFLLVAAATSLIYLDRIARHFERRFYRWLVAGPRNVPARCMGRRRIGVQSACSGHLRANPRLPVASRRPYPGPDDRGLCDRTRPVRHHRDATGDGRVTVSLEARCCSDARRDPGTRSISSDHQSAAPDHWSGGLGPCGHHGSNSGGNVPTMINSKPHGSG
jgi:hypothetical protein